MNRRKTAGKNGVFNQMDDRKLKKLILEYADDAPEDFWMDGEYTGSVQARVRQMMKMWRWWPEDYQQDHHDNLLSWGSGMSRILNSSNNEKIAVELVKIAKSIVSEDWVENSGYHIDEAAGDLLNVGKSVSRGILALKKAEKEASDRNEKQKMTSTRRQLEYAAKSLVDVERPLRMAQAILGSR